MATFGQIKSAVSKRLLDPDNTAVSDSDVADSINSSVSYWKFYRFWFNEVSDTATLTAQDPSFPYPSDFLVPATKDDGFNIQYSAMRYPLVKKSQAEYDAVFLTNGFGIPQIYARMGSESYQCYPIPDQDYVVGRHYLKDYTDMSGESDGNDFTIFAPRLISLWSLADLSAELRQDEKMEDYYRNRADVEYENLQRMTEKSNSTGTIELHSII